MILRLKPYAVNVKYIPSSRRVLHVADRLSRAYLPSQAADQADEFEIHSGQLSEFVSQVETRLRVTLNFNSFRKLS